MFSISCVCLLNVSGRVFFQDLCLSSDLDILLFFPFSIYFFVHLLFYFTQVFGMHCLRLVTLMPVRSATPFTTWLSGSQKLQTLGNHFHSIILKPFYCAFVQCLKLE